MDFVIARDDPTKDDVHALLERHLRFALEESPPEHVFALDAEARLDTAVTLFSARRDGVLLGVGAIKELDACHGELKAMHTDSAARRQGVARAIAEHLLSVAAERGYRQVSLETGSTGAYLPARLMYAKVGFTPCEPFGPYSANPDSLFMTIHLESARAASSARAPG